MTRFFSFIVICGICLSLLAVAGCKKKGTAGANIHGPALTPYQQTAPEKLERIEVPPVMKEHKDMPGNTGK